MAKPINHGNKWTWEEDLIIRSQANFGVSTEDIANKLGRTVDAVYTHASEIKVSLMPVDKKK